MKKIEMGIVISFLLLITLVNVYWIRKNIVPPGWDDASYLEASERIYQSVDQGIDNLLITSTEVLQKRAPLIAYVTFPIYLAFGSSSLQIALIENLLWLVLFCIFLYLLLKNKFNQKVAVMSVLITPTMPLFYGLIRHFYVEFGLMTIIVIWIYFLFKTEHLSNEKYLLILGFITGLGILMKITFPIYVSGFLLLETYEFLRRKSTISKIIQNLTIFLVPCLIAVPWYLKNLPVVLWHAKRSLDPSVLQQFYYGSPFSPQVIYLTLLDFVNYGISGYYFTVAIVLIFWFVLRRKIRLSHYLVISITPPILFNIFSPNKDYRLLLPIMPIFGLGISWLFWKTFKKRSLLYLPLLLFIPSLIFINTSISLPKNLPLLDYKIKLGPILISDKKIGEYVFPPEDTYWPTREALNFISNLPPRSNRKIVLTTSEIRQFNINNLKYYATKDKRDVDFKSIAYSGISYSEITKALNTADYIIELKSSSQNSQPKNLYKYEEIIPKINWTKISNDLIFPDGYKLIIYQNPEFKVAHLY